MGVDETAPIVADGQSLIAGTGEGSLLNWAQTAGGGITIITPEQAVYGLQNQQQVVLAGGGGGGGAGSSDQIAAQQDAGAGKYSTGVPLKLQDPTRKRQCFRSFSVNETFK